MLVCGGEVSGLASARAARHLTRAAGMLSPRFAPSGVGRASAGSAGSPAGSQARLVTWGSASADRSFTKAGHRLFDSIHHLGDRVDAIRRTSVTAGVLRALRGSGGGFGRRTVWTAHEPPRRCVSTLSMASASGSTRVGNGFGPRRRMLEPVASATGERARLQPSSPDAKSEWQRQEGKGRSDAVRLLMRGTLRRVRFAARGRRRSRGGTLGCNRELELETCRTPESSAGCNKPATPVWSNPSRW
jgi:hypothetical protein